MFKAVTRLVDWLLAGAFFLALTSYAYLGSYSRYMADDYAALRPVRAHGFFGAQINWYQVWTGRFSYTFLYSLLALFGPVTPRYMPGLLLSLWFAATLWATYEIDSLSSETSWPRIALIAGFIIFATLETAPNLIQSLYWQTAAITHVTPFIPFTLYVGLLSRVLRKDPGNIHSRCHLVFAGILTFVSGGLGDAFVVFQSCVLILSVLAAEVFAHSDVKSRSRGVLMAGLVGSLLALAIVISSPGNSIRQAFYPRQFSGWSIVGISIWYSVGFIARQVLHHPVVFLASLTLPLLFELREFSFGSKPRWGRQLCIRLLWITPGAVFLLITCCTGAGVYAISVMLPQRAQILLSLIFTCGTLVWSRAFVEYVAWNQLAISNPGKQVISVATVLLLVLLTLAPLKSFVSILRIREQARSFASDWDNQDAQLRAAKQSGATDVTVPQIGDFQSRIGKGPSDLHLRTEPEFWINKRIATYYGLRSVRASEEVVISR